MSKPPLQVILHWRHIVTIEKGRRLVNNKYSSIIERRDGIKTRGDKIGMALCIIKPLNDVRPLQTTMPADNTSPILPLSMGRIF